MSRADAAQVCQQFRLDEEALALLLVGFGFENFRQAGEMVGIAVRHEDALDGLGLGGGRSPKPAREIARKHLVVAAIHELREFQRDQCRLRELQSARVLRTFCGASKPGARSECVDHH